MLKHVETLKIFEDLCWNFEEFVKSLKEQESFQEFDSPPVAWEQSAIVCHEWMTP